MNCDKCGAEVKESQSFCSSCGTPVSVMIQNQVKRSPFAEKRMRVESQQNSNSATEQMNQDGLNQSVSAPNAPIQTTPQQPVDFQFEKPAQRTYQQPASALFAQMNQSGIQQPVNSPFKPIQPSPQQTFNSPFAQPNTTGVQYPNSAPSQPNQAAFQQPMNTSFTQPIQHVFQKPVELQTPYHNTAYQQTVYQQPAYQQPGNNVVSNSGTNDSGKKGGTPGLVLGIVSLAIFWIPYLNLLTSIPASIISIVGMAKKNSNRVKSGIAFGLAFLAFILGVSCNYSRTADRKNSTNSAIQIQASVVADGQESVIDSEETTITDLIVGEKTSFKDLGIGGIGKKDGVYVGLQYVRELSYLPTKLGEEDVESGNVVILAFFELYNSTDKTLSVDPSKITCYVDGTQVNDVESYIKVYADGVAQYYNVDLDAGCQLLSVQDFEVPSGWNEIKFFYQSDCVWTISQSDVGESEYGRRSLFNVDNSATITNEDDIIFSDNYDVQYKGMELYHYERTYGDEDYIIVKFHVTNNSEVPLDTSLMGFNMRCYQDNFYLGDSSFTIDKTISNYVDLHEIDSIEAGMSADIYLAFETTSGTTGSFYMIYDDGYIKNHYCGSVYDVIDDVEDDEEYED